MERSMIKRVSVALMLLGLAGCDQKSESNRPKSNSPSTSLTIRDAAPADANPKSGKTLEIAVIPKGTTHDFWKSMHAGAIKAQRELGNVNITFRGPEKEDDRAQEIELVQNFISNHADAIVLAPLDDKALAKPVRDAT